MRGKTEQRNVHIIICSPQAKEKKEGKKKTQIGQPNLITASASEQKKKTRQEI